jgi:multicomponent Na+:H+ antiporter subunit C
MTATTLYGLCAAALVGIGLYGFIVHPAPLRKILAFNIVGSGVFLLFGVIAHRGAEAGFPGDPVPQALLITGIVVAFSASALAVALLLRLHEVSGSDTLANDVPATAEPPKASAARADAAPPVQASP